MQCKYTNQTDLISPRRLDPFTSATGNQTRCIYRAPLMCPLLPRPVLQRRTIKSSKHNWPKLVSAPKATSKASPALMMQEPVGGASAAHGHCGIHIFLKKSQKRQQTLCGSRLVRVSRILSLVRTRTLWLSSALHSTLKRIWQPLGKGPAAHARTRTRTHFAPSSV